MISARCGKVAQFAVGPYVAALWPAGVNLRQVRKRWPICVRSVSAARSSPAWHCVSVIGPALHRRPSIVAAASTATVTAASSPSIRMSAPRLCRAGVGRFRTDLRCRVCPFRQRQLPNGHGVRRKHPLQYSPFFAPVTIPNYCPIPQTCERKEKWRSGQLP